MSQHITRREWIRATGLATGALALGGARAEEVAKPGAVIFQRALPLKYDVDVFIAGGGPAGTAAAVAARNQGASVYLAEAHTCLGGMGTAAHVPVFMPVTDGVNFLPGGYGRMVLERLKKEQSLKGPANDIEALKRTYDALLGEAGAQFTFYTRLAAVEAQAGRVAHVLCAAPSGLFAVRAKVYVDATGNGDLAA
ncbi:MAG: FAD-dependent oxidoreductase, partial [Kiritimatiellaeota bacterium]|nr:FAD-dependent oxidoreductase [Kiritimatiellota bacterium]